MALFSWLFKKGKDSYKIKWTDRYSVGIVEIDAQHRKLFALYNNLIDAMYEGEGIKAIGPALDELLGYSITHFMTEEGYFEKYNYPEYNTHKQIHVSFRNKFYNLHKEFNEGKPVLTSEVIEYLRDWLHSHVLKMDQKYAKFLRKAGAR